ERCQVVELGAGAGGAGDGPGADPAGESGGSVGAVSRSLLTWAVGVGRPVVAGAGEDAAPAESLLLAGMRSALCAPIVSDDEVVACLYVTQRHLGDLFGDLEIQ